jgi:hypothetical protein
VYVTCSDGVVMSARAWAASWLKLQVCAFFVDCVIRYAPRPLVVRIESGVK